MKTYNSFSLSGDANTLKKTAKWLFAGICLNIIICFFASVYGMSSNVRIRLFPPEFFHWQFSEQFPVLQAVLGFFLLVVFLIPAIEELVFRSLLQSKLVALFGTTGVVISVCLFVFAHGSNWFLLIVPACFFAWAYSQHKLTASYPAHVGFNLVGFISILLASFSCNV